MSYLFSVVAEYHSADGVFDASQTIEAADALAAVDMFLQAVRERLESGEVVTVVKVVATIRTTPESGADSGFREGRGEQGG